MKYVLILMLLSSCSLRFLHLADEIIEGEIELGEKIEKEYNIKNSPKPVVTTIKK